MDMFTSKSDIDLSVNFSCDEARCPREKQISLLRNLSKALFSLQRQQLISGVTPILRARVPILKCTERRTGIECDISVENKDGIVRSGMLRIISSIDKRFRPLSTAVP
ncbi:HESO1 protein [Nymphaea thermarum]|nr:HESO1 protein [Nymphaea thermarum]